MIPSEKLPVLVTGGSRGIGRSIATRIGHLGWPVLVGYVRNAEAADSCLQEIEASGGQGWPLKLDITEDASINQIDALIASKIGSDCRLAGIVNNAGIGSGAFETTSVGQFDSAIRTNVRAPFFIVQKLSSRLADEASVINISSGLGSHPHPSMAAYSISKAAVNALTGLLAIQFGERKIRVNGIAPGWTETDINAELLSDKDLKQTITNKTLFGRLGKPDDIAGVAAFLMSDESKWVTGQIIGCSGGFGLKS